MIFQAHIEYYVHQIEKLFALRTSNLTDSEHCSIQSGDKQCKPVLSCHTAPEHSSTHSIDFVTTDTFNITECTTETAADRTTTAFFANSVQLSPAPPSSSISNNNHYIHTSFAQVSSAKQLLLATQTSQLKNHYHHMPHHYRSHRNHHYIPSQNNSHAQMHDCHNGLSSLTDNTNTGHGTSSTSSMTTNYDSINCSKQTKSTATLLFPEMLVYQQNVPEFHVDNLPSDGEDSTIEHDQENVPPTFDTDRYQFISLFATEEHLSDDDDDEGLCDHDVYF